MAKKKKINSNNIGGYLFTSIMLQIFTFVVKTQIKLFYRDIYKHFNDVLMKTSSTKSQAQIRLLEIHPWLPLVGLRTALHITRLEDGLPYEAISYIWGSPDQTHVILASGRRFRTTAAT
ncbi:hypothetical protein B0O99DRAFT_236334 [Bisporella sp. PMI_857]|nr:hypothetical protein B0O99DRAFT_236334 [Bisporella sp. PMI_857]